MAYRERLEHWIGRLLSFIRLRPFIVGMEISDSTVRLAHFSKKAWRLEGIRLEPGVLNEGRVKNYPAFVASLKSLRLRAFPKRRTTQRLNVVSSLSSASVYSQVFAIPMMKGESFDRAVELNLQMVSPMEFSKVYSGWQKVGEDAATSRLELLGAFIERSIIDNITQALFDAGFVAVAVESKALALARLLREQGVGIDLALPYILLGVDGAGVDFLIIRGGQLYFEYFTAWKDIADEKGQISVAAFKTTVLRNMHQILNFYGQHWLGSIAEVVVAATTLQDEAEQVLRENFPLSVKELRLRTGGDIRPEWFVTLGCGLRGEKPRGKDVDISLLGIGAAKEFHREQVTGFLEFWRVLLPSVFGVILLSFLATHYFLYESRRALMAQTVSSGEIREAVLGELQQRAQEFNQLVQLVKSAEATQVLEHRVIKKFRALAEAHAVTLARLAFQGVGATVSLAGTAPSQKELTAFKEGLLRDPAIRDVSLPIKNIALTPRGVEFTLTLIMAERP